jgi:hypothetical protein
MFDSSKAGKIENEKVRTILNTLGLAINDLELEALLEEEDKEGNASGVQGPSDTAFIKQAAARISYYCRFPQWFSLFFSRNMP